jgi:hypothetical protein
MVKIILSAMMMFSFFIMLFANDYNAGIISAIFALIWAAIVIIDMFTKGDKLWL